MRCDERPPNSNPSDRRWPSHEKGQVTVTVMMNLPPGVELVERFVDDGENLGAHFQVGGELFCPSIEWMRFVPRTAPPAEAQAKGFGHGYQGGDESIDDWFFGGVALPRIDHTIEPIEE